MYKQIYHFNDGNYKGWSFYGENPGAIPSGFTVYETYTNTARVAQWWSGISPQHLKIVKMTMGATSDTLRLIKTLSTTYLSGIAECYMGMDTKAGTKALFFCLVNSAGTSWVVQVQFYGDGKIYCATVDTGCTWNANNWYHLSLRYRATGGTVLPSPDNDLLENKCRVYIDGVKYGDYTLQTNTAAGKVYHQMTSTLAPNFIGYVDAIGFVGENSYTTGLNLVQLTGDDFFSKCTWGIVHQVIEDSAWARFISTELIYEGELIKIYDENVAQLFYGKVVQAKDLGGVSTNHLYEYECWGKEYSDLTDDVALDYSGAATDCATIARAAIDVVKSYISQDATAIPATAITCKPKWTQTPLIDCLNDLAWRCNSIWYALNSSGKIYFRLTSNLIASGITLPDSVKHKIWECEKNMEFINYVQLTCSNGLTSVAAEDADSIAQYNYRTWKAKKFFVEFYEQTEADNMAIAIRDADKIKSPDAVKRCVIDIYEQIGIQVGTSISVTSTNFDALATAKTLIIVEVEHNLKINATKIWCTENILRLETGKDYYNEKITALEEGVINASGKMANYLTNCITPNRIYGQSGFTATTYGWFVAHTDTDALVSFVFVVPETRSDWVITMFTESDTASRTDSGTFTLGVCGEGEAVSENNVFNAVNCDVAHAVANQFVFTDSSPFSASKNDLLLGYWVKDNNAGTGYLYCDGFVLWHP